MANELQLVDGNVFSIEERSGFEQELDKYISRNKDNRQEINRLVFEAVATMTEADEAQADLENKSFLQRLVGGFTGSNKELQDKINKNRAAAQYAAQQTLNKLAEQNMMSFELIASVNNKLNALSYSVNEEFKNIYAGLAKFLRHNRNEMAMMVSRLDKIEQNVNLLTWQNSIEYQEFNGVEYVDMNDAGKIVCLTRDFYDITKGNWSLADLLLLKTAMSTVNMQPKKRINYYNVLQDVHLDRSLQEKLLGTNGRIGDIAEPEKLISLATLAKLDALEENEKYVVDTVVGYINEQGGDTLPIKVQNDLVSKYMYNMAHVNVNVDVDAYDMILDLLYNMKSLDCIDAVKKIDSEASVAMLETSEDSSDFKEAEKLYLQCKFKEAAKKLTKCAEKGNTKAMYMLGEIYHGLLPKLDCDDELAHYWWYRGAIEKDELCMKKCYYGDSGRIEIALRHLAADDDMYAQYLLGMDYFDEEKGKQLLRKAAEKGYFLAMEELGCAYMLDGNENQAKIWLQRAGEAGYDAGWYLLTDIVGANNTHEAWRYYQMAYELKGNYSGASALAMGDICEGFERFKWYNIAGELGCSEAYYKLGEDFKEIYHRSDDDDDLDGKRHRAIQYYQMCYDYHEKMAGASANRIGLLYDEIDSYEANEWYKKSADEGYDWGCYNLGMCYYDKNDVVLAIHYFLKAYELKGEAQEKAATKIGDIYAIYFDNKYMANEWHKRSGELRNENGRVMANEYL